MGGIFWLFSKINLQPIIVFMEMFPNKRIRKYEISIIVQFVIVLLISFQDVIRKATENGDDHIVKLLRGEINLKKEN